MLHVQHLFWLWRLWIDLAIFSKHPACSLRICNCLVSEGILEPVQFADWAELIVPVLKSDGQSVSICGDFRLTINQASRLDRYPIPRIEDLFACQSKWDFRQAYQQVLLTEEKRPYAIPIEVCGGKYPSWL